MTPTDEDNGKPAVHENGARGIVRRVYVGGITRPMREEVRVEVTVAGTNGAPVGFLDPSENLALEDALADVAADLRLQGLSGVADELMSGADPAKLADAVEAMATRGTERSIAAALRRLPKREADGGLALCEGGGKLAEGRHETATAAICPWCHRWCAITRGILDERPVFAEHEPQAGEHERIAQVRRAAGAAHPISDLGAQTVATEDEGPAVARAVLCAAYWAAHAKGVRGVRGTAAVALVYEVSNQATVGAEGALRWLELAQQNGSHHDQLLIAINLAELRGGGRSERPAPRGAPRAREARSRQMSAYRARRRSSR